jgi:hypothetical protein
MSTKSTTPPPALDKRSMRLPTAPPSTRASAQANHFCSPGMRRNQKTMKTLTPIESVANSQRCQPPASRRKLNAAPVL